MEKISRKKFLSLMGLGTAGIVLSPCVGCSKEEEGTSGPSGININLDLNDSENEVLKTNGGYRQLTQGIVVAKAMDGKYYAVQSVCPHESFGLVYDSNTDKINCSNHTNQFFSLGGVSEGQRTSQNLTTYTVTLNGDILNIKS